jgi:hypothetical protein
MIGNLLIVHEQNTELPPILRMVNIYEHVDKLARLSRRTKTPMPKKIEPFSRVLNVYVPRYPEFRIVQKDRLEGIVSVPFPRLQEFQEISYGLVERIGQLFEGWTEIAKVATPWQSTKHGGESMEFRWIYDHIMIAVNDENWQDRLLVAEAECEEAFLAVASYYSEITPLPRQKAESKLIF